MDRQLSRNFQAERRAQVREAAWEAVTMIAVILLSILIPIAMAVVFAPSPGGTP